MKSNNVKWLAIMAKQKKVLNTIVILVFLFLLVGLSSCKKFLDVEPPNSKIPNEQVFSNDVIANSALAGIYLDMYGGGFADGGPICLASLTGLSADELHYNNSQPDATIVAFETNRLLANNKSVLALWISMYKTIYQANAVLEGLAASTNVSPAIKEQLRGEALFIRAFCYFYLVSVFGDVPLITTTDYTINAKISRISQSLIYDKVEADLVEAENLLPESYTGGQRIRPVKAAATALLARLYLYRENWPKAAENASKIIDKTGVYGLEDSLNNVFLSSSREAIWQLRPKDNASSTHEGYNSSSQEGVKNNVLSNSLVHSFQVIDKRRSKWIKSSGALYLLDKYKLFEIDGPLTTEYSMVFRLAEQHLIRAEARAHLGMFSGNNSAESDINLIRHRAGLADTVVNDNIEDAMRIIENERKLELFTEWGHRWFDLKRWNKATEILSPLKSGWSAEDMLYPIPQEEMNRNPFLRPQNLGYE